MTHYELRNFESRFLSLVDLDPLSPTFGCGDRDFWHYRSVRGFPICTFQNLSFLFALWAKYGDLPESKVDTFRQVSSANALFWARSIGSDGSLQENYQGEASFVGTAFSLYHVSSALQFLQNKWSRSTVDILLSAIEKSSSWLSKRESKFCANQNCAAIAALVNVSKLNGDSNLLKMAQRLLDQTYLMMNNKESWLAEYGGYDFGYTTVTLDYLARAHSVGSEMNTQFEELAREAIKVLFATISEFSPSGANLGSRNTAFLLPFGIRYFGCLEPGKSSFLLQAIQGGMEAGQIVDPKSLDDRYLCTYGSSFVQCFYLGELDSEGDCPVQPEIHWMPKAGYAVKRSINQDFVVQISAKRGGCVRVSGSMRETKFIPNFSVRTKEVVFSPSAFDSSVRCVYEVQNEVLKIVISGFMRRWKYPLPLANSIIQLGILFYQTIFRKFHFVTSRIDSALRRRFIIGRGERTVRWQREIEVNESQLTIQDHIFSTRPIQDFAQSPFTFAAQVNTSQYWCPMHFVESCSGKVEQSDDRKHLHHSVSLEL